MLPHTFCHVPGLGTGMERRLWDAGLLDWAAAMASPALPLPAARAARLRRQLPDSAARLAAGDIRHFAAQLPAREHWRLFHQFRKSCAYLDIETTGAPPGADAVTTIALYDGHAVHTFVRGRNLHEFAACLERFDLLVTFNGKSFDLPVLRRELGVAADQAHIDLRYVLASLGYRGGLKRCERQLGLDRGALADVDGFVAVLLWQAYGAERDPRLLETLLAYNALDAINLEQLMVRAYNLHLQQTPFAPQSLPLPPMARNPFTAHAPLIHRVRRAALWA